MLDSLILMTHKQCYVGLTTMLNKRCYTSDIVVFDMFTAILANTFNFHSRPWRHSLKLLSMKRC